MNKAYFFPRLVAYVVDVFIVSMVASLICYFIPMNNYNELQQELTSVQEKFLNEEISEKEYLNQTALISYDLDYAAVPSYIVQVAVLILYYVVFQFYNKGQTLGKKLMKIRVVANDDKYELTINDYIYRSVILNALLANFLLIIFVLFLDRNYYFYTSFTLQIVQIVLSLITIFMVLFKKDGRGLHDMVAHSKVVMVD